ncbi:putative membrane insertase YidC/ALB3/OXA1/COX18, membrane insertase YidC/Oxa1 [Helianthus annuus]|nr:putative membrane insertase YidC/ALB3/OXA1/COX18, membrane insertase YidC/Oxa1 [Helianthus annuus]
MYTLADAAVAVDAAGTGSAESAVTTVQKSGGWFGFISDAMEVVLKVLKDGLSAVHVPYSYGFAIILLTVIVKLATLPLTKQQVESTLAMQNLQPKLKAIQQRYAGNQERIQLETSRLYRQAGVNPLAGCLPTLATIPVWIGLYQALSNVANEGLLTEGFFWIPSLEGRQPLLLGKVDQESLGSFHLWMVIHL